MAPERQNYLSDKECRPVVVVVTQPHFIMGKNKYYQHACGAVIRFYAPVFNVSRPFGIVFRKTVLKMDRMQFLLRIYDGIVA